MKTTRKCEEETDENRETTCKKKKGKHDERMRILKAKQYT